VGVTVNTRPWGEATSPGPWNEFHVYHSRSLRDRDRGMTASRSDAPTVDVGFNPRDLRSRELL
jgi:hypothetical protein